MHNYSYSSALDLVARFRVGELTPADLLSQVVTRIDPASSVFTTLTLARAEREAAASTLRWQEGCPLSPLDGVPIAWKDLFDIVGTVTTTGAEIRKKSPTAKQDSALVAMAATAGLVCIGKTNLSEFAYSGLGLNPHFGTPTRPLSMGTIRIPGGSSSGSAIAVADGIVPIAMGTDTAGSIRVPAAFNGLVGFRPSQQRYAGEGVFPLAASFDCPGPLAGSVTDIVAMDGLFTKRQRALPATHLSQLRLVIDQAVLNDPSVTTAVRSNLEQVLARLAASGAQVEYRPVTTFWHAIAHIDQNGWLGGVEAFALHRELLDSSDATRLDPRVRQRLEGARHISTSQIEHMQRQRCQFSVALKKELNGALLVTPTVGHVAPPLAPLESDDALFFTTNAATLRLTMPGSLMGMPGISLPSGQDAEGLPTGLLLSAPDGADEALLSAALSIEKSLLTY